MPPLLIRREYVTFLTSGGLSAVDSHTYGWKVISYTALRGRTRVGANRAVPGRSGRNYVEREWDEHRVVLTWRINGLWDKDGVRYDVDPIDGVDLNHQVILDNVVNANNLRDILFHHRQGTEWDGSVVVENWEPAEDPDAGGEALIAPMTLVIPAGYLTPA
jgi:hypothetical protein